MSELKDILLELRKFAQTRMVTDILHGWPHVERVLKYASKVNEEMRGDWNIIEAAILLHDLGHKKKRENHNKISAQMAEEYLMKKEINPDVIEKIKNCILTHSRQFSDQIPDYIEAKIVFDADGMDLFGAIGLMRALLSCALRNQGFECMIKKLEWRIKQKPNFYSNYAREFVIENSIIIETYLKELKKQI